MAAVYEPGQSLCHESAGLHTVKLQQLIYLPDAAVTVEALASLPHLRTLQIS